MRAQTDKCGRWPEDILQNSAENKHYANFGCSYQNNLAAQIANPADLLGPRKQSPIDAERRSNVIDEYRRRSGRFPSPGTGSRLLIAADLEGRSDKMSNLAYETEQDEQRIRRDPTPCRMKALRPVPRISIQAFCETEGVANPIERAGEDRRMAKAHLKVHMGGIATAIEFYQTAPTPNLIILESRREPRELLEALRQLAEYCDPTTKVVVIGHYNDVWLYRELIRSGISEYVVAPISMADIVGVISSIFVDPEAEPIGRSIAFIGAKGGVGSSTIAHNVAWAMSSLFKSEVVVADLDLAFGTANINFDQDPAQGIAEAVFAPERIDEVYLDRLLATMRRASCRCLRRLRRSTASTISIPMRSRI